MGKPTDIISFFNMKSSGLWIMGERRIEEKSVSSLNLSEKVNSIETPPWIPVVPDSGETFTKVGDISSLAYEKAEQRINFFRRLSGSSAKIKILTKVKYCWESGRRIAQT